MRTVREEHRRSGAMRKKEPRRAKPTAGRRAKPTTGKTRAKPTAGKRRAWPTAGNANQRTATETRRSTMRNTLQRKVAAQPVPKHPRTDADVQQEQYELELGEVITTIPKIDFNEETVECKNLTEFHRTEGYRGDSRRGQRRNEETLGTQTFQTAQKQRLRKSRRL